MKFRLPLVLPLLFSVGCGSTPPSSAETEDTGDDASDVSTFDTPEDTGVAEPDTAPDAVPDTEPDVGPDAEVDADRDVAPDADRDVAPDADPDVVPDADPDVAPDVEPDTEPDVEPDVVPDVEPDVVPDVEPDVVPDVEPDVVPDVEPDVVPDVEPDVVPDVEPDVVPDVEPDLPVDGDGDEVPETEDCDDTNPAVFPGATEVCDGLDNDCRGDVDEGVISDGNGCADPGPPPVSDRVSTVQVTIRSGDELGGLNLSHGHRQGGGDADLDICVGSSCWSNVNHPNWDDLMPRSVDVYTFEGLGLDPASLNQIQLSYDDGTDWEIDCVQVTLDGRPAYCREGIGAVLDSGSPNWSDVMDGTTDCVTCWDGPLSHGPMVGATTDSTTRLWGRADAERRVEIYVAPSTRIDGTLPVAYRYPQASRDFTFVADIEGLSPRTSYDYRFVIDGETVGEGTFRTAPADEPAEVTIGIASCAKTIVDRAPEQLAFGPLAAEDPDLFLFVGDNVYFDPLVNIVASDPDVTRPTLGSMRQHYRDQIAREPSWSLGSSSVWADFGRDLRADFLANTPTLTSWDDHDFLGNNTYGIFGGVVDSRRDRALRTFREYWANPSRDDDGPGIHYSHRWGDLEFFIVDNRYFRDPSPASGAPQMLGSAQLSWLFGELRASTATFKFIVNGSGWSTEASSDAYGGYPAEQVRITDFIADEGIEGVVLISGDVHRSELRLLPGSPGGYSLPEFVSSPIANTTGSCHATNDYVHTAAGEACYPDASGVNPSFVTLSVDTTIADPLITARMRDEDGALLHSWTVRRSDLVPPVLVPLPDGASDFNGDGLEDLLVGIPDEDLSSRTDGGTITALPGSTVGLRSYRFFSESQEGLGFPRSEAGSDYGQALATGDFDGDGYSDAAVGAPDDQVDGTAGGSVVIIYGGPNGLGSGRAPLRINQDTAGMPGGPESEDNFGEALAAGEFNCDAYDDLAIGTPGENDGEGHVYVVYGSASGLVTTTGVQDYEQDDTASGTTSEAGDRFGTSLAAGRFAAAACDGLAVGSVNEDIDGVSQVGLVEVIDCACGTGLTTSSTVFHQGMESVPGSAESGDHFGQTLSTGDFNGDTYADLAVGAPGEAIGSTSDAGYVFFVYGGAGGLSTANNDSRADWHPAVASLGYGNGSGDEFGVAIAAGDFDADGFDDAAIGAPGRSVGGDNNAGGVFILFGGSNGIDGARSSLLTQDDSRWMGAEAGDAFGDAVSAGDFNGDGYADLAAGAPDEAIGSTSDAGVVLVFLGGEPGPAGGETDQRWHQDMRRLESVFALETGDRFGAVLAP